MLRILIAGLVSTGIALAAMSPSPARAAGPEDIIGVLAGIAALAIIARELDDDDKRSKARPAPQVNRYYRDDRHYSYRDDRRRTLPAECLRRVYGRGDTRQAFSRHCLKRSGVGTSRLSDRCAFEVRTDRGWRTFYGAHCLRRDGWRIAENRRHRR